VAARGAPTGDTPGSVTSVTTVLLAVRFLSELALLAALAVTGWRLGDPPVMQVVLAVLLPLVAVAVWGRLVAPRASGRLADPSRLAVETVLFTVSAVGLVLVGFAWVGVLYGVVAVGVALLVRRFAPEA
jgi:Protein of unknown function (DUF2568)